MLDLSADTFGRIVTVRMFSLTLTKSVQVLSKTDMQFKRSERFQLLYDMVFV